MKAAPRHIIAERSWPVGSAAELEPWAATSGAVMTIDQAKRAYDQGTIEMCQGREEVIEAGRKLVVVSLYAIPRQTPRRVERPTFGRGNAGHRR